MLFLDSKKYQGIIEDYSMSVTVLNRVSSVRQIA